MTSNNSDGGFYQLPLSYYIQPFNNIMQLAPNNRLNPLIENIHAKYNELCRKYKQCKNDLKELREKEEKIKEREEKLEKREKELKEKEEAFDKKSKSI